MQDYNNVDGGEAKLLQYACRTCDYMETVPGGSRKGACVYSNEVGGKASETAGVTQDVGTDPTLPHADKKCPACPLGSDCVYFQSQQRTAETGMVSCGDGEMGGGAFLGCENADFRGRRGCIMSAVTARRSLTRRVRLSRIAMWERHKPVHESLRATPP